MRPAHGGFRFDANISILFPELPMRDRPAAAAAAGFDAVETWWPFEDPVPTDNDVEQLRRSLADAGTQLVALNLDGGDTSAGDRGLISLPTAVGRVRANAEAALEIAEATGCTILNALYGNRLAGVEQAVQEEVALDNLAFIADAAARRNVTVVLETLNRVESPHFPLTSLRSTLAVVAAVMERTGLSNVGVLFDVYHLYLMGYDVRRAVRTARDLIAHVQFADFPGRGRPGTGQIDFDQILMALASIDYRGFIGVEYIPTPGTRNDLPALLAFHATASTGEPLAGSHSPVLEER